MSESVSKWLKIAGVIATLALIITLFIIVIQAQQDVTKKQEAIEKSLVEMRQLQDGIVRSEARYVTKEDLEKFAKDQNINLEAIRKDLDKLGADVKGINTFLASTPGYNGTGLPSTGTTPRENPPTIPTECQPDGTCPNLDPFGYQTNAQHMALAEPFANNLSIPFGETIFKAWMENPWDVKIFPRNYKVTTVLGQDEEGRHYTYNKFTIETGGKSYDVPISESKFVEQYPEPSFHINPRVHLAVGAGPIVNPIVSPEFTPSVQVFAFSYGTTKKIEDTQWSLLGVGVGFETQQVLPALVVSPAKYNLGYVLPYVDNLHIGPSVTVDIHGQFSVLGELSVGL